VTRAGRWRVGVVLLVLLGLAVRVAYVWGYRRHVPPTGDAFYFHYQANLLASGHGFLDPYALFWRLQLSPGASHPPLWTLVLAVAPAVGVTSFFAQLVWGCVLGSGAVAAVAVAGREVAGPRVGLVAAAVSAVYPVFVMDDGSLLAETVVVPLVALVVWACYRLWRRPTPWRAAVLGALCALCALARSELVLLVVLLAVPAGTALRRQGWRPRLAVSGAAVLGALCMFAPWWAYTVPRFSHPVLLSDQLGVTLATANCAQTYGGRLIGYWDDTCETEVPVPPGGAVARDTQLEHVALRYAEHHAGQVPAVVAARLGRALGVFRPAQQIDLEWSVLGRPRLPATIGLFGYYVLIGFAVLGVVDLRSRRIPLAPFVVVLAEVVVVSMAIFGQTRYRDPLDVALVILAAVGVERLFLPRGAHVLTRRGP